jgi:spore maturation protein B
VNLLITISHWAVPVTIIGILIAGVIKRVRLYEVFVQGAMEGIKTTVKLTPYLLAIFVAIGLFRASGALGFLVDLLKPALSGLGIPAELVPLGLLKPLSGSASLGFTSELLQKHGPDTPLGIMASLIQGSSETTFYVFSLYLGSVQIRNGRHLLLVGLLNEWFVFLLAIAAGIMLTK